MKKTIADLPSSTAAGYTKLNRPSAASSAAADGYTETKAMRGARASPSRQFGLPKSVQTGKMKKG
jgi:hypothetical protein